MARPSKNTLIKRRNIVKSMFKNNPSVTQVEILRELERKGIKSTFETIAQDMKEVREGIEKDNRSVEEEIRDTIKQLDKEIELNKKLRDEETSGTPKANFSRLVKDLYEKKVQMLERLSALEMEKDGKERPIYHITIGDFPVLKDSKKQD